MTHDDVLARLVDHLRRDFGAVVVVRDLHRTRRVEGDAWTATLAVASTSENLVLGEFDVGDEGALTRPLTVDAIVQAARRTPNATAAASAAEDDAGFESLDDLFLKPTAADDAHGGTPDASPTAIYEAAMAHGDRAHLRRARDTLPRFLVDGETRGVTLFMMSEVERRLGETQLALGYLEAATRELASRFDVPWMDRCELAARILLGAEGYRESVIARTVESNRARLRRLPDVNSAPILRGLPDEEREWLTKNAVSRTLQAGEFLVREGEPSRSIFVIQSGVIAVIIAGKRGESRLIRCLYPGLLLGESSVLSANPKCTASLRAEQTSEVWEIDAAAVQLVIERCTAFNERLQGTRYIHQIDSFFSLHDTIGNLDAEARDNILSCVHAVQTIDNDVIALSKGEVPEFACLVARGELALYTSESPDPSEAPVGVVGVDQFFGFRDALHQIASERTAVALRHAVIIFFNAERLRSVAAGSSDDVTLTLERLG